MPTSQVIACNVFEEASDTLSAPQLVPLSANLTVVFTAPLEWLLEAQSIGISTIYLALPSENHIIDAGICCNSPLVPEWVKGYAANFGGRQQVLRECSFDLFWTNKLRPYVCPHWQPS